ncbi:hypothetical protein ACO1O0_002313 [Amphichorda felina]
MASQSPPLGPGRNGASDRVVSGEGVGNFRFTFSCSSTGSSKGSFIEPDPNLDNLEDSSESLSDSVQNYPEEFGRTYHAYRAGSYAFPNDSPERERLSLQSDIITALFGGRLFFAPLAKSPPPRTILDVATGTGDWAIQMGDLFPQSEITATDLSPIQPAEVPPNVNFYVEDSSETWDYTHKFDFIHTRITAGCWSDFKTQIAEQAFASLYPGGWFESQEFDARINCDDGTLSEESAMVQWFRDMAAAGEKVDRPLIIGSHLRHIYEEVGFVDVHERIHKIPTNGWARDERLKELGRMWERNMQLGMSGFSCALFNRVYGRSVAETEVSHTPVK